VQRFRVQQGGAEVLSVSGCRGRHSRVTSCRDAEMWRRCCLVDAEVVGGDGQRYRVQRCRAGGAEVVQQRWCKGVADVVQSSSAPKLCLFTSVPLHPHQHVCTTFASVL